MPGFSDRLATIGQMGSDATAIAQARAKNLMAQKQAAVQQAAQSKLAASNQQAQDNQTKFKASMDANTAALNQFASQNSAQNQARIAQQKSATAASAGTGYSALSGTSEKRQAILNAASSQLGVSYSWGGGGSKGASKGIAQGANTVGFDCSGLVQFAYSKVGLNLPRTAATQATKGIKTSINKLQPGDLVAWNSGKHIAVYAGNGQIIEAPRTGLSVRTRALTASDMKQVHGVALSL